MTDFLEEHTISHVSGYRPTLENGKVYLRGISDAEGKLLPLAAIPNPVADAIITVNGLVIYVMPNGVLKSVWTDQHAHVARILKAYAEARDRMIGRHTVPVKKVSGNHISASRIAVGRPDVLVTTPADMEPAPRDIEAMIQERCGNVARTTAGIIAAQKKLIANLESSLVASRKELQEKLETIERYMKVLGAKVLEDKKRVPSVRTEPFAEPSDAVEWTQSGGLRDGLAAVHDNPFVRR